MAYAPGSDDPLSAAESAGAPRPPGQEPVTTSAPPSFLAVLRHPGCGRLLVASLVGRVPLGMVPIALILTARADGHSLGTASLLAAVYGMSPALGLPVLGRMADARGLALPCGLGAVLVAAALVALAVGGSENLLFAVVCAAVAGACCPPLEGGLRSLWPVLLPDAEHTRTAYTLDSSTQQIVYVAGPVVTIVLAGQFSPVAALLIAATATVVGSFTFSTAAVTRAWRAEPRPKDALAALRPPAMRPLLVTLVLMGITIGALDVAAIASADRHRVGWLAGAMPAVFSAAGLLGGALFVRLKTAARPGPGRLLLVAALYAGCWIPLLAPVPAPVLLALSALPGALFVPLLSVVSFALTSLAPPGTSTEVVGWLSSAMRLGLAGGTALAGPLGGHFVLPLLSAGVCVLLLAVRTAHRPAVRQVTA
ncbi:MFS transporter [Streptomyces sp. NPDC060030]|uniref:MFS transporter n=1 Tax=Streptomyces sp. NPDC060030 TaxID=3347042 RepID=UPI0036A5F062